ncbi:hypothetical protein CYMTET_20879 [Cymbomonas tetramitiformis]|uniref:Uncharacterized protein n=1 Tax=Cymbomonas tetramitiformis TaxID=36881 RepID=A0AAE0L3J9_9CHLO|nr:hypothetical protein CYMTET_20879 [Cymbomonas tetramitiformis]
MWMFKAEYQPSNEDVYLLDARWGSREGFIAARHHGNIWDDIYVNTEKKQLGLVVGTYWTSLPTEEWGHIHMEPTEIIADDITIFAQVEVANSYTSGCMAGTLAELYLWSQPLLPEELAIIYQGFDQTTAKGYLAAYFALEEGEGDVAWDHIDVFHEAPDMSARLQGSPSWILGIPDGAGWHQQPFHNLPPMPPRDADMTLVYIITCCVVIPVACTVGCGILRRRRLEKVGSFLPTSNPLSGFGGGRSRRAKNRRRFFDEEEEDEESDEEKAPPPSWRSKKISPPKPSNPKSNDTLLSEKESMDQGGRAPSGGGGRGSGTGSGTGGAGRGRAKGKGKGKGTR